MVQSESKSYKSVFRKDFFAGNTFVVTGGNSGIGRCIAHELSSLDANVVITGRSVEKLRRVEAEIEETGGRVVGFEMDVREERDVRRVMKNINSRFSSVDGLVNCAGGQFPGYLEELSLKGFNAVVRNNLVGTFNVTQQYFKSIAKHQGGSIVTISMDYSGGVPLLGHSAASRAGMDSLTQTEAVEWARFGVRVNSVGVGYIASSGLNTYSDERMLEAIPEFGMSSPIGRMGTEAEISAIVAFLLSPASVYITGQVIKADGGFSLNCRTPTLSLAAPVRGHIFHGFGDIEYTEQTDRRDG